MCSTAFIFFCFAVQCICKSCIDFVLNEITVPSQQLCVMSVDFECVFGIFLTNLRINLTSTNCELDVAMICNLLAVHVDCNSEQIRTVANVYF